MYLGGRGGEHIHNWRSSFVVVLLMGNVVQRSPGNSDRRRPEAVGGVASSVCDTELCGVGWEGGSLACS